MPSARTASPVTESTQAILTPANALASRPNSVNFSHTARTELVEVKTIHWYRPSTRPLTARSIWAGVRGGSTAMVGTRSGMAPCPRNRSTMASWLSLVWGTSTRQPYMARDSHQESLPRWDAPAPRAMISDPDMSAADAVQRGQCAVDGPLGRQGGTRGDRRRRLRRQPRFGQRGRRVGQVTGGGVQQQ